MLDQIRRYLSRLQEENIFFSWSCETKSPIFSISKSHIYIYSKSIFFGEVLRFDKIQNMLVKYTMKIVTFLTLFLSCSSYIFPPSRDSSYLRSLKSKKGRTSNYLDSISKNTHSSFRYRAEGRKKNPSKLPIHVYNENQVKPGDSKVKQSSEGNFQLQNVKDYNFTKIGGYDDLKVELYQMIDMFKNSDEYKKYAIRIPKGLLLEGPSGNGKTLLAKCLAGEANSSFIATVGSEFNEKYVGVGAARIRELFEFARVNQPCIVFVDEVDALGRKRSSGNEGAESERDQTLNQLLSSMDGFQKDDSVMVLGATNRVDILDTALKRPGRFDKIIHVPNPDAEARAQIISIHLFGKPINATVNYLVEITSGMSGAQIENLLNEVTLLGIRRKSLPVGKTELEEVKERMLLGAVLKKKQVSEPLLKRIAVHEMGHYLTTLRSTTSEKPSKITIDTSSPFALGYMQLSENDNSLYTLEYLEDKLCILLGGRIAEEIVFGTSVSTGALSDLETAFLIAKQMVMNYGMGKKIVYPYFSEQYKKEIDDEIHSFINAAYRQTKRYLEDNKVLLNLLSKKLFDSKTLYHEDIIKTVEIFNRRFTVE
jgi:cell division protease FtsH